MNFDRKVNRMNKKLVIKRVRLTFDEWNKTVPKKEVNLFETEEMYGAFINIIEVKKPQVWFCFDKKITVADNGYKWLVVLPKKDHYAITMYMDRNDVPLLWYIDLIDGIGVDANGIPFYNDMFLDLIVSDDGQVVEDDRDEFEKAYFDGIINNKQYQKVISVSEQLKQRILENQRWISEYCRNIVEIYRDSVTVQVR